MIRVIWEETQPYEGGWVPPEKVIDLQYESVTTVGFLIHDDGERLVVGHSVDSDGNVQGVIVIPRTAIIGEDELVFG